MHKLVALLACGAAVPAGESALSAQSESRAPSSVAPSPFRSSISLTPDQVADVRGAPEALQRIIRLDRDISAEINQLNPEQRQEATEFRDLAFTELMEGVDEARQSPSASYQLKGENYYRIFRFVTWGQTTIAEGRDRVRTYIRAPGEDWTLSFVTLLEYDNNQLDWQSYTYGNPMDTKTYMFQLRGPRSETAVACMRRVPVRDDPTVHQLSC